MIELPVNAATHQNVTGKYPYPMKFNNNNNNHNFHPPKFSQYNQDMHHWNNNQHHHHAGFNSFHKPSSSQQPSSHATPLAPLTNRQVEFRKMKEEALQAVEILRVRGLDYADNLEDTIEFHEDPSRCFVQLPAELFDALEEDLRESHETTLVYKAVQPLVGMVFGKHGSAAHHLHRMGATLELASKDRFHIRCPRSQAAAVQAFFEERLANILVRMNMDNVTVVMRPEKLMIMLTPFTLTPVLVLGMLSAQLVLLRIHDKELEEQFGSIHHDIQQFYGGLSASALMQQRLSLPVTPGTLAAFFDESSNLFVRVVVEDVCENVDTGQESADELETTVARIWKMDFGGYEWVNVQRLLRLQMCYLQAPRQCFAARLLYAKKSATCRLSPQEIYTRYFHGSSFFALSLMENPADLSHVVLFQRSGLGTYSEFMTPKLEDLQDVMETLVAHDVYQTFSYAGPDFSAQLSKIPSFRSSIPYGQLCREVNSVREAAPGATPQCKEDTVAASPSSTSSLSRAQSRSSKAALLQGLLNPYQRHPEKRCITKHDGWLLSAVDRPLRMNPNNNPRPAGPMPLMGSHLDQRGGDTKMASFHKQQKMTTEQWTQPIMTNMSTYGGGNPGGFAAHPQMMSYVPQMPMPVYLPPEVATLVNLLQNSHISHQWPAMPTFAPPPPPMSTYQAVLMGLPPQTSNVVPGFDCVTAPGAGPFITPLFCPQPPNSNSLPTIPPTYPLHY